MVYELVVVIGVFISGTAGEEPFVGALAKVTHRMDTGTLEQCQEMKERFGSDIEAYYASATRTFWRQRLSGKFWLETGVACMEKGKLP